jgi:hypothetical protein
MVCHVAAGPKRAFGLHPRGHSLIILPTRDKLSQAQSVRVGKVKMSKYLKDSSRLWATELFS